MPFNLVIRHHPSTRRDGPDALYRITPDIANVVFDPQFSPDGQYILLKAGWPYDRRGAYKIYLWDIKAKKLQAGPEQMLKWRTVSWSPDGNYLAYIKGGDAEGLEWGGREAPLQLYIYDIRTNKSRIVAKNRGVTAMAWTSQNTLLYAAWPEVEQKKLDSQPKSSDYSSEDIGKSQASLGLLHSPQPTLYEVPVGGDEAKEITKDIYGPTSPLVKLDITLPAPSPDNKWIAFLGRNDKNDKGANQPIDKLGETGIYLFNRLTQKRIFAGAFTTETEDFMRWSFDSKTVIAMKTMYAHAQGTAHINLLDVNTIKWKELVVLKAQDIEMIERPRSQPQFQILGLSKNSKWLFVKVSEAFERHDMFYTYSISLQAIDMTTGKVSLVARIENFENNSPGMDWLDESTNP